MIGRIEGHVTDAAVGSPLVAATIRLDKTNIIAFSHVSGWYGVDNVPEGRYSVVAEMAGYEPAIRKRIEVHPESTTVLNFSLKPLGGGQGRKCDTCKSSSLLLGKVTNSRTEEPVPNAQISIAGMRQTVSTTADGLFSLAGLPDGDYDVVVEHDAYRPDTSQTAIAKAQGAASVDVALRPLKSIEDETGTVTGSVTDSVANHPVVQATVSLLNTDFSTLSDSDGVFRLKHIPPSTYTLLVTKWGYETKVEGGLVVRAKEETSRRVLLASRQAGMLSADGATGAIQGIATGETGHPFQGALVLVRETGDWATTDHLGRFSIDSIRGGVYTVVGAADGYDTTVAHDVDVWNGEAARVTLSFDSKMNTPLDSTVVEPDEAACAGLVVDSEKQTPLAGAAVDIGADHRAVSGPDGKYLLKNLPPGTHEVRFTLSGYEEQVVNVDADAGELTRADASLTPSDVTEIDRVTVRAAAVQSTSAALLKERREAISFTDAIGSQEISRTGAGNAADAMKSVTGASIVGGKYVLIRGLPERYSITMLNGAPIPSPDPDRQAVNMDLFPAAVIENITTSKTFVPNLPANFAGGVVDIRTKPFPEKFTVSLKASAGYNSQATFWNNFPTYDGGRLDWLGIDDDTRALPSIFNEYSKTKIDRYNGFPEVNHNSSYIKARLDNPNDKLVDSLLLVDRFAQALGTEMDAHDRVAPPDQSYSLSIGNTFDIAGRPLGLLLGTNYGNKWSLSLDDVKRDYSFNKWPEPEGIENDYKVTNAKNTVVWGGLASGSYIISRGHTVRVDYMYVRNAADLVKHISGYYGYYDASGTFDFHRLHFAERSLNYVQPNGAHTIWLGNYPVTLGWSGSYTRSTQDEPDMRNIYHFHQPGLGDTTVYKLEPNVGEPSHQWRSLEERAGSGKLTLAFPFYQWTGDSATASIGGSWFGKKRRQRQRYLEYQLESYIARLRTSLGSSTMNATRPGDLVSAEHLGLLQDTSTTTGYASGLFVKDQSDDASQWDGKMDIAAAFAMVELPLFGNISTTLGVRYERSAFFGASIVPEQRDSTIATLDNHDILPSASVAYALRDNMNVRAAYGKTLVRPSMREKARYKTEAFSGGPSFLGNEDLESSLIDNVDLRWEWFMKPGELLAASAFFKRIAKPIEITFLSNDIRKPANTESDALIWGVELEARKQLTMVDWLKHCQVAGNVTLAKSRVDLLDSTTQKLETYFPEEPDHRPFQGQSPYVINAFLTYDNPDWGANISAYYNVFGERLGELTDITEAWIWQKPEHMLNATASKNLGAQFSVSAKAGNILNSTKRFVHHHAGRELVVKEEKPGRSFSLGLSYTF